MTVFRSTRKRESFPASAYTSQRQCIFTRELGPTNNRGKRIAVTSSSGIRRVYSWAQVETGKDSDDRCEPAGRAALFFCEEMGWPGKLTGASFGERGECVFVFFSKSERILATRRDGKMSAVRSVLLRAKFMATTGRLDEADRLVRLAFLAGASVETIERTLGRYVLNSLARRHEVTDA